MGAFASPREAVEEIAKLLRARDWAALAACYDGPPPPAFYQEREGGHPSGADDWVPFPPGWSYLSHETEGDVAVVRVGVEIDEGGGMIQRGVHAFRLRRTPAGWKLLA